jgi:toxin ParE1/3/4
MEVRWSPQAAEDFTDIIKYIREQSPSSADRISRTIYNRIAALGRFPDCGRPGRLTNTRELVLAPLPFIAIYRVQNIKNAVEVIRVLHGAQRWP